jgi:hypothetical protein
MGYPETLLVRHLQAATLTFRDIVERITGGRNPFTNAGIQYKGSHDDAALNSGVPRFTADPGAVAALNADGRPTGVLPIPVVTIHSINDPQVVVEVEVESAYRQAVTAAGSSDRLVQAYTDERGHALQSPPEVAAALDSRMQWIEKGTKPSVQSIAAMCDQVKTTLDGHAAIIPNTHRSLTIPVITLVRRRCANLDLPRRRGEFHLEPLADLARSSSPGASSTPQGVDEPTPTLPEEAARLDDAAERITKLR